jgi:Tat protein secretion system quality control protein TatD with DNase activity
VSAGRGLVDTHVHLNSDQFAGDLAAVLARATAADVTTFVTVGYDLASSVAAVELAEAWGAPGGCEVYATAGIHPHDAATWESDGGWTSTGTCRRRRTSARPSRPSWTWPPCLPSRW